MSNGQITPIYAPQAPSPPAPPPPPISGYGDPKTAVRKLVTYMKEKKSLDLDLLPLLPLSVLEAIEQALLEELDQDELKKFGYKLRRIIRFVLAKNAGLLAVKSHRGFSPSPGRKQVLNLPAGKVTLSTGVKLNYPGRGSNEGYTISFDHPADNIHWLQFIWRNITAVSQAGGNTREMPIKMRLDHAGRVFLLTSDVSMPRWTTDGGKPGTPFYEENTASNRLDNELTIGDDPSPMETSVAPLFKSVSPPAKCISKFHAAAYLIKDMEVLYRADVELVWTITDKRVGPAGWIAYARPASELDAAHRAALAMQFPKFDYFPGPPIGAPVPRDNYDPVSVLDPLVTGWVLGRKPLERYETAAVIAKANLIEDVVDEPKIKINETDLDQGLNYKPSLSAPGETGYVDVDGKYSNPKLPTERFRPLPKVASILGDKAFSWGSSATNERNKDYTIATVRHEMAHASHNRTAIGWLLKWRDELTKQPFEVWLGEQNISPVDLKLVSAGIGSMDLAATEALAWTEGFVTALPFLPAHPMWAFVDEKDKWPAAIAELAGGVRFLSDQDVENAVKARIQSGICGVLRKDQRDAVVEWINFLIDPKSLNPTTADDKGAVGEINSHFGDKKTFLEDIRKIVQNCRD